MKNISLLKRMSQRYIKKGISPIKFIHLFQDSSEFSEFIYILDEEISKNPNSGNLWDVRGWTLRRLKRYIEALKSHDKALELGTTNPFNTWFNRGIVLELLNRPAEAKASYQQAINSYNQLKSQQQNDPENLYFHGWIFFLLQSYQESLNSLQKAIELDPFYQHIFNWVFPLFINFSQESIYIAQEIAKSLDQHTLKINPIDYNAWQKIEETWCKLGLQWEKLNQISQAHISYEKALAIKPDSSMAIECKKRLTNP